MASTQEGAVAERPGLWSRIWRRPKNRWLLGVPLGGLLALILGAIGLGGVNWAVHETSSTAFCLSCHSHQQFIKPEYEASSHFKNEVGVRAQCADCHLPHDNWFELMFTKVLVSKDLIGEAMGKISTRERYEAHRGEMAQTVWRQLVANGSKFCRSCHNFEAMDLTAQGGATARNHKKAMQTGMTCVECHRGIVHKLPDNADDLWAKVAPKREPAAAQPPAAGAP
jgi:trimethylamine-N-oxide reductase (cytochrome c), cytochrome c-type subunit TorC